MRQWDIARGRPGGSKVIDLRSVGATPPADEVLDLVPEARPADGFFETLALGGTAVIDGPLPKPATPPPKPVWFSRRKIRRTLRGITARRPPASLKLLVPLAAAGLLVGILRSPEGIIWPAVQNHSQVGQAGNSGNPGSDPLHLFRSGRLDPAGVINADQGGSGPNYPAGSSPVANSPSFGSGAGSAGSASGAAPSSARNVGGGSLPGSPSSTPSPPASKGGGALDPSINACLPVGCAGVTVDPTSAKPVQVQLPPPVPSVPAPTVPQPQTPQAPAPIPVVPLPKVNVPQVQVPVSVPTL